MLVYLNLEASKPNGTTYRLALGCGQHPNLASLVAVLIWLIFPRQQADCRQKFRLRNQT